MAHTNSTPNYHLPQFVGTDKPAWLTDVNQAMSDIDTQMKANATSISGVQSTATTANTNANQAKQSAEQALQGANTAQATANTAQGTATTATTNITKINNFFSLSNKTVATPTISSGRISGTPTVFHMANSAGTCGKIATSFLFDMPSAGSATITINTAFRPSSNRTLAGYARVAWFNPSGSGFYVEGYLDATLTTAGKLTVTVPSGWAGRTNVNFAIQQSLMLFAKPLD